MRSYIVKILIFSILILTGIYLLLWILHADQESSPLQYLALSHYTHPDPEEQPFWIIDYLPFVTIMSFIGANVIWFLIELFLVEPSYFPAHDSGDITRLMQKRSAPMNHIHDALYTCPDMNADKIESELISQGVSTTPHPK